MGIEWQNCRRGGGGGELGKLLFQLFCTLFACYIEGSAPEGHGMGANTVSMLDILFPGRRSASHRSTNMIYMAAYVAFLSMSTIPMTAGFGRIIEYLTSGAAQERRDQTKLSFPPLLLMSSHLFRSSQVAQENLSHLLLLIHSRGAIDQA
ncbi:hypothetical protein C8Q72DRAFT_414135 [Fomitopsis betulina]|nr:hypothetical protein C8Q72DRAFT_414135 [Fomitopsis betulina]